MYTRRTLEDSILRISTAFPILLLAGPRQVGKTTSLESCGGDRRYVTLDDLDQREIAHTDPALQMHLPPPPSTRCNTRRSFSATLSWRWTRRGSQACIG